MSAEMKQNSDALRQHIEDVNVEKDLQSGDLIDRGNEAVLLDLRAASRTGVAVKLASDGHTVLVPQPTDDPDDPLFWSSFKKHIILFIVALSAFLGDFGSASGVACLNLQGEEWNMSPNAVNYSGNLNVAMLAVGGLLWIPPIYFWGRAPVILWSTVLGTIFTLVCVVTPSFQVFYGFRALMGITLTAGQTVGLAYIKDIFYFHEHARKIGLWASLFLCSPFLAPCLGNIMVGKLGAWRPVFWLVFALCCFDLLLILAFLDETLYRRDITTSEQPPRGTRLTRVTGIWQVRHRGYLMPIKLAIFRLFVVFSKPIIIPCMLYYASTFMWAVGINITGSILLQEPVALGGYGFGAVTIGFVYFTPVVSVGLGELFGHYFNDWNAARYIARHGGVFRPEARLWVNYVGGFLMAPGLVLLGQALQHRLTVGAVVMGWGMYMVGIMIASVGITAYVLDAYPTSAGEVSALLNFARAFSGFTVGYFQVAWGERTGFGVSFGIQGMIVGVATILLALIHIFGERLRKQGGALPF